MVRALERYAATDHGDLKRQTAAGGDYRLRVGAWRVRLELDYRQRLLRVLGVQPRGRAYRD